MLIAAAEMAMSPRADAADETNPFFTESPLPLHYPEFDKIGDSHFAPAFDAGMAAQLEEVEAIADNPRLPTFENTIVALERSGRLLDRATTVFFALVGADTNDERNRLRQEYSAKFSAHSDTIRLNGKLFARIARLYRDRAGLNLDPEALRLLESYHRDFVRAGAGRSGARESASRHASSSDLCA